MFNMSSYFDWEHGIIIENKKFLQALSEKKNEKIVSVDFLPIGLKKLYPIYKNILLEKKAPR